MDELASPINILSALKRLRHELVTYVGLDVYAQMSSNFDLKLAALQASHNIEEQETLADELQDMLLPRVYELVVGNQAAKSSFQNES